MSNAWEIHTLGGGTYLYDLFNGIAALTSGKSYLNIIGISAMFGLGWALLQVAFNNSFRWGINWFMSFMLMYNVMFVPKATVIIHDPLYTGRPYAHIDNIPLALATFASVTSTVGKNLTELMETAFTPVDYLPYHKHGMLFGARLMDATTSMKIVDEAFAASVNSFMKQCVFYDLLLHRYSLDDLKKTDDIWNFLTVTNQASLARSFVLNEGGKQSIMTCRDGTAKLNERWAAQIGKSAEVFGKSLFPDKSAAQAKTLFLQHLPASFSPMLNVSKEAVDLIKQNLLINAIDRAGAEFSNTGANANIYTEIRGNIQTKIAFNASRKQAAEWVPILRIVFEVLFYGAFPLIFLLFLTPKGPQVAQSYFCIFVGLQAWGPLYAILNLVMSGSANHQLLSMGEYGLTIMTQAGIAGINQSVAEMAGYVAWMIPFLSAGIAAGTLPLTSLATPMLAIPQSAASSAAHEAATGNISLGNANLSNASFGNVSGNKINDSAFFDSARVQTLNHAGGITTLTPDGRAVYDQMGSVSRLANMQLTANDTASQTAMQSASVHQAIGQNLSLQASDAKSRSIDQLAQHMASHAVNESSGIRFAEHTSADVRQAYSRIEQEAKEIARTEGIDDATAFNMVLSGNGGVSGNYALMGKGASGGKGGLQMSANGGSNFTMSGSADTRNSEGHTDTERASMQNALQRDIAIVTNAVKDRTLELHDSRGNTLNENFTQSYLEAQRLEDQSRAYLDTAKSFNEQAQLMRSKSLSFNEDMNPDVIEYAKSLPSPTGTPLGERALGLLNDPIARKPIIEDFKRDRGLDGFNSSFKQASSNLGVDDLNNQYANAKNAIEDKVGEFDSSQARASFNEATYDKYIDNHNVQEIVAQALQDNKQQIQQVQIDKADLKGEVKDKLEDGAFFTRMKSIFLPKDPPKSNFDNSEE